MRATRVGAAVLLAVLVTGSCASDGDGQDGEPLARAAEVPDDGGFELSIRLGPQDGELTGLEGGEFATVGRWQGDDVAFDGGLDLAPTAAELSPAEERAYRSDLEARLVGEDLYLRSAAFGEDFVSADASALDEGTVVAPVVVVDASGVWQPIELWPLLADASEVLELDRVELEGTATTRYRAEVGGDLDSARAAVGLDADGDGRAAVDAYVDENGEIRRLEADVDAGFLVAHVVPDASAPARLRIDFVDDVEVPLEAPDEARDVTSAF